MALLTFSLFGLLIVTKVVRQRIATESQAVGGSVVLTLAPSSKKISSVGQQVSFDIVLHTNQDTVSAVALEIGYDPAAFEKVSYKNKTAFPIVLSTPKVLDGKLNVVVGVHPTSPFKGTTIVGTITLQVKSVKASTVSFTENTKTASLGKTGNTIKSKQGATITTFEIPTLTPTSTPTPTIKPTNTPTPIPTPPDGLNVFLRWGWDTLMKEFGYIPKRFLWLFD